MKCPKCEFDNPDGIKFCGECGAKLERICPQCSSSNPPGFKFCGECGYDLTLTPEPVPQALSFEEMERKRTKCWEWKVQIADCRYRPLIQTYDYYNPSKKQTDNDYYIHHCWTDEEVKQFRRNVRRHNICIRHGFRFYSRYLEDKKLDKDTAKCLRSAPREEVCRILEHSWFPEEVAFPEPVTLASKGTELR